jgi:O-antigen ligase
MLPPARDPLTPGWLAQAALTRGEPHLALADLRNRLRSRYDAPAVFLTDSGTGALILALRTAFRHQGRPTLALPAYGCYALVSAAVGADARILFYDLDPRTLSPDEDSLRAALERGAGTVVVAHFFGYPARMESALSVAHASGALVVEDAAQAGGGTLGGAPLGSFGDLTVFSHGRGKGATAGAGGSLLVRNVHLVEDFRLEMRDVIGSDGPGRAGGWHEWGLAAGQWALGRPGLFRIPRSIPALALGETHYRPPRSPAPMAGRAALLLRHTQRTTLGETVLARQRRALELESRLRTLPGVEAIRLVPGAVAGALRLPFLMPDTGEDPVGEPSLGIVPPYPGLLPHLDEAASRTLAGGETTFPGAAELRRRLHTAPTHEGVRDRDVRAMARWVEARAGPARSAEPRQRRETVPSTLSFEPVEPAAVTAMTESGIASSRPERARRDAEPTPGGADAGSFDFGTPWAGAGLGSAERKRARPAKPGRRGLPWDLLMMAVVLFVLTSVARIHLLFPVLKPFHPTQIAAAAAIFLFAVNYHPTRRLVTIGSPVSSLLLVLMGWMAMTVPFALRGQGSLMFLVSDFSKTALLFFLIVGGVRAIRDVERLAYAYFIGAALYAGVILARYSLGDSWRFGNLVTYDANDFALYAVTAIPLGIYFLGESVGALGRIVTGFALAVVGVGFVQAGSRGGFLAFLTVIVFLVVRHKAIPFRWRVTGLGLLALTLATAASGAYWDEMATLLAPSADYNLTAETGRMQIWQRGMGYLWRNPFFGVGPANFPVAEGVLSPFADRQDYGIGVIWTSPHNAFVQIAVELGVPGLLIFLTFLGSIFVLLHRMSSAGEEPLSQASRRARGDRPGLAQALTGSLMGFIVGAFFLSMAYSAMLFTLAGLAGALWKTTRVGPDQRTERNVHPTRLRRAQPGEAAFLTGALDARG